MCLACGHVGCCDSSPNRHATKHFRSTGHPLIRSLEQGEEWLWCYLDEVAFYPTALSSSRIFAHYTAGQPAFGSTRTPLATATGA